MGIVLTLPRFLWSESFRSFAVGVLFGAVSIWLLWGAIDCYAVAATVEGGGFKSTYYETPAEWRECIEQYRREGSTAVFLAAFVGAMAVYMVWLSGMCSERARQRVLEQLAKEQRASAERGSARALAIPVSPTEVTAQNRPPTEQGPAKPLAAVTPMRETSKETEARATPKNCPNKELPEWKTLVNTFGESFAYAAFCCNGHNIPSVETAKKLLGFEATSEWKTLVASLGEDNAYIAFRLNKYHIPDVGTAKKMLNWKEKPPTPKPPPELPLADEDWPPYGYT